MPFYEKKQKPANALGTAARDAKRAGTSADLASASGPTASSITAAQSAIGNRNTSQVVQRAGGVDLLDHVSGKAIYPKKTKDHEHDDEGQLRVNPAWIKLEHLTGEILDQSPKNAKWQYAVTEENDIYFGSEDIASIMHPEDLDRLHQGMKAKDPELTRESMITNMDKMGHPTISAHFDQETGRSILSKARLSGEMHFKNGVWTLNDKSGRYMAEKVRGKPAQDELRRWMSGAAKRIGAKTGKKIDYEIIKHAE